MAGVVGAVAGRIRNSPLASSFLDGVNAAALALKASADLILGRATLVDSWTWTVAMVNFLLLVRFKMNATWLILGGAALGILLHALAR